MDQLLKGSAVVAVLMLQIGLAQESPLRVQSTPSISAANLATKEAAQIAAILGLQPQLEKLQTVSTRRPEDIDKRIEALELRQSLLESIQRASLEADGVLAELSNERNQLGDLMTILVNRRDRSVSRLNTVVLIAGSGIGVAMGGTQFPRFSDKTQTIGNVIAVAAGATASLVSLVALRRQGGPEENVGNPPNMLAPLLGGTPALNTDYPPAVMRYLNTIPLDSAPAQGTRLEQLKQVWVATGRLNPSANKDEGKQLRALTASGNSNTKVTINEIRDRIAMLGDVMGRVSLMKRDLGFLIQTLTSPIVLE